MDDEMKAAYNACCDAIIESQMKDAGMTIPPSAPLTLSSAAWDGVTLLMGPHISDFPALQHDMRDAPLVLAIVGEPGLGKSYHFNPFTHESAAERESREEGPMWREQLVERKLTINYLGFDEYFPNIDYQNYRLLDEDKKAPEWQKRRNRSASAKQDLIDKLKAKRNAR